MSTEETEELHEGWQAEKPYSQRIYHYIVGTFSLCGRLGFYLGEKLPDTKKRNDSDCKTCIRKLDARYRRQERANG